MYTSKLVSKGTRQLGVFLFTPLFSMQRYFLSLVLVFFYHHYNAWEKCVTLHLPCSSNHLKQFGRQIFLNTKDLRRLSSDVTVTLSGYVIAFLRSTKAFSFPLFQRKVLQVTSSRTLSLVFNNSLKVATVIGILMLMLP